MVRTTMSQNIMLFLSFLVGVILTNGAGAIAKGQHLFGLLSFGAVATTIYLMKQADIEE